MVPRRSMQGVCIIDGVSRDARSVGKMRRDSGIGMDGNKYDWEHGKVR